MDDMLTTHPGLPCRLAPMPSSGRKACVAGRARTFIACTLLASAVADGRGYGSSECAHQTEALHATQCPSLVAAAAESKLERGA